MPPSLGRGDGPPIGAALDEGVARSPGVPVGPGVASGVGEEPGRDAGVGWGVATGVGDGVGLGVGAEVGRGVGFGVGAGVAVGRGVGLGVGLGVGAGVGAVIVTVPADSRSSKRSRLIASMVTAWAPTGSVPDQVKRVPVFQLPVPDRTMAWLDPAAVTRTQSAGEPSRLRYVTVTVTTVCGVPERGDAPASDRRVGPEFAAAGAASAATSSRVTRGAPRRPNAPMVRSQRDTR
jgi:hypothetical protein